MGRGLCIHGGCYCSPGFAGEDCSELDCPCDGGARVLVSHASSSAAHAAAALSSALAIVRAEQFAHPFVAGADTLLNVSCGCACHDRALAHPRPRFRHIDFALLAHQLDLVIVAMPFYDRPSVCVNSASFVAHVCEEARGCVDGSVP